MRLIALTVILGIAGPAYPTVAAAASDEPMAQLRQSNEKIDRILKRRVPAGSGEERAAKAELKQIVNGFLDYRELARRSLAQHWDKLSKAQQEEFVNTLRDLIEKNYVKQLRTNLQYEVLYKDQSIADGQAEVNTVVKVKTRGKSTDTAIDYKMRKGPERWMVYDIVTDEVSMVRNYRAQFNKIITNESYDALLKKMRKKIAQTDEMAPEAKR